MSYFSRYDKGDWKALCDVCGREYKASQLNKRWDGLMCCRQDWEPRQPQDFVRGVADPQLVPWTRPEPSDSFLPLTISNLFSYFSSSKSSLSIFKFPFNYLVTVLSSRSSLTTNVTKAIVSSTQLNGSPINVKSLG